MKDSQLHQKQLIKPPKLSRIPNSEVFIRTVRTLRLKDIVATTFQQCTKTIVNVLKVTRESTQNSIKTKPQASKFNPASWKPELSKF